MKEKWKHSQVNKDRDFCARRPTTKKIKSISPHAKSWLIGKNSDAGRDWGQEEKGTTEDEIAGWHHWLNGRESQWPPGVGDGQGGLACCDSWGRKESDTTERLIWSDLILLYSRFSLVIYFIHSSILLAFLLTTIPFRYELNQIYNGISPHSGQNGHHQKLQTIHAGEVMEKRECFCTVCGNVNWHSHYGRWLSVQFSSVAQSCPTLCDPMNCSTQGLPVHHQLPEFTKTHVHRVGDAIQLSHPLLSPSPPAPNPSQHQSLFQWVNSSHEVAKVLEFQL